MKAGKDQSQTVAQGLMDYLSDNKEVELLGAVTAELEKELGKTKNATEVVITSPFSLTLSAQKTIVNSIRPFIKTDLPVIKQIDKSLLGGFTVKVGDWFLDASLLRQLNALKSELISN